jgi:transcriptional regulator with XRE-family HTH domain
MGIPIGEKIRQLRVAHGLTQRGLAHHLKVSAQAVSKWELGYTYPDLPLLVPIAELFSVSIDELFGYEKKEIKK